LSVFNKLLEKLVSKRLMEFIDKNNILFDKQFGFRSSYSTSHALLSIIDNVQQAIDDNSYSCGIFLDLSKAFDSVNHSILLNKLDHYGINGIAKDWFASYLSSRMQLVSLSAINSDVMNISCGVPQGSVLGPTLFLIYINDFHNSSSLFDFHLFADDANLFYRNNSIQGLEAQINIELANIQNWLLANKLLLNIEKSNYIIFHSPQKKIHCDIELCLNSVRLKRVNNTSYLGVMIDSNLNWKAHVAYVAKKVRRNIGLLSKIRHYASQKILVNLYYSLIYPFITYGVITWGNTYPTTLNSLYLLQKKALRLISFSGFRDHSNPLFIKYEILKLPEIVFLHNAVFVYNFRSGKIPKCLELFFEPIIKRHNYATRLASNCCYSLPKARTNYGKFALRFAGVKTWNAIDKELKQAPSISSFKNKLKKSLLKSYEK
jgi:hypothetical protein